MTTIAFKDGVLAADRCLLAETTIAGQPEIIRFPNAQAKISRVDCRDGVVRFVSGAGRADYLESLCSWVSAGMPGTPPVIRQVDPDDPDSGESLGLVFTAPDIIDIYSISGRSRHTIGAYAMGSGASYALGAMEAGASAVEAIRIASIYDAGTSDRIDFVSLEMAGGS